MADDPKIYLIDPETGKAHTTADGTKMKLSYFTNDPEDEFLGIGRINTLSPWTHVHQTTAATVLSH